MSAPAGSGLMDTAVRGKNTRTSAEFASSENNLHDKFVTYVQALTGSTDGQSAVWMEHSYARARRGGGVAPRTLLVRRGPACPDCHLEDDVPIDVETVDREPEPPLEPEPPPDDADDELVAVGRGEPELASWEEELEALAPSPAHRRLAAAVLELIRSLRTARLAGAPRTARAHARRLRRELAPLWSYPGPLQQRPAAWMHAALSGYLPRPYLEIYNDMVAELARSVPRLVERLLAGQVAPAPAEREATGVRLQPAADRPLLVWIPSGREKRDAIWERRLCHLIPVHRIKAPIVAACSPEAWCTAVAAATRSALASLATTPRMALALGGWGAGAALAIHVAATWDAAAGIAPRCLALLAPPLLTAEGPRDSLDDPLLDLKVPVLFVVGQNAMQCTVGTAEEVRSRLGAWSRLVVVGGADDALRLTRNKLRMERVTQQMVEAALAEEVRGFVAHAAREDVEQCPEGAELDSEPPSEPERAPEPPLPAARRRVAAAAATPPPVKRRYGAEQAASPSPPGPAAAPPAPPPHPVSPPAPSAGKGRGLALLRVSSAPLEPSLSHLAGRLGSTATDWEEVLASTESYKPERHGTRNIRIMDSAIIHGTSINGGNNKGYSVVSRGTGSVPLSLPPPRRAAAPAPAASLATADIMQLPIVFADDDDRHLDEDELTAAATPPPGTAASPQFQSAISVRAPLKYTKVILAKRPSGAACGATGSATDRSTGCATAASSGNGAARPIIVKGGLKIMPKTLVIKRSAVSLQGKSPAKDKSPV